MPVASVYASPIILGGSDVMSVRTADGMMSVWEPANGVSAFGSATDSSTPTREIVPHNMFNLINLI